MKVLVTGAGSGRLELAAAALARRGHEVLWAGGSPPAGTGVQSVTVRVLATHRVDVAIGDGARPERIALLARLSHADAVVLAPSAAAARRWGVAARWAVEAMKAFGLIEPGETDAFRAGVGGLDPEKLALWSDELPPLAPEADHVDTEILERACERALSRRRAGGVPRTALFVDRDGTLVREVGYLADPADIELLPGVPAALRAARAAGHPIVVVSNQSGVGRGLFPASRVYEAMSRLRALLRAEDAEPDAIYFCPHRPDAGCPCRKPRTGLLDRAAEDQNLSLKHSLMVGDKLLDVATGHAAGGLGALVRTGYGRDEEQRAGRDSEPTPDVVGDGLAHVVAWWLAHPGRTGSQERRRLEEG